MKFSQNLVLYFLILILFSESSSANQCYDLLKSKTPLTSTDLALQVPFGELINEFSFESTLIRVQRTNGDVEVNIDDLRVIYQIDETYLNYSSRNDPWSMHPNANPELYASWVQFMNTRDMKSDLAKIFSVKPEEVSVNTSFRDLENTLPLKVYYGPYNKKLILHRGAFLDTSELIYVIGSLDVRGSHNLNKLKYIRDGLSFEASLSIEEPNFVESRNFDLGGIVIGDVIYLGALNSNLKFRFGSWGNVNFSSLSELSKSLDECLDCALVDEDKSLIE